MNEEKQLITEVETDLYLRKKGKRKNVKEEELFDKEDYCEGEFIPGFHDWDKMILETFLIAAALPFVALTLYFGTKGGYYDTDDYTGTGCAHDVQRWLIFC